MKKINPISRRVLLRGLGASLVFPMLETFGPATALAASKTVASPKRMIFLVCKVFRNSYTYNS